MNPDRQVVKRRLAAIVVCSFVTGLALSVFTVILPLYATRNLGLSNAGFARVLSLRMAGITVGVILIGAFSDRFGNKRLTIGCLALGGVSCGLLGVVPLHGFVVLVPLVSALLSCSFVNLNFLTQIADPPRQGRVNTLYRSAGTLAGILVSVLGIRLLTSAGWLFAGIGASLCVGAWILRKYPLEESCEAFGGWIKEFGGIFFQYRRALREVHLMRFIHLSLLMMAAFSVVGTFLAIRLTSKLGASAEWYGNICAVASGFSLVGIVALGAALDRVSTKWCFVALSGLTVLSLVALGLTNSATVTAVFFVIFTVVTTVTLAPSSMWISRETGAAGMGAAFSVHKVLNAVYAAAAIFLFSLLEPSIGIRRLFLACGTLSGLLLVATAFLRLPPTDLSSPPLRKDGHEIAILVEETL